MRCAYPPYKILGITFNVGWVSEAHPPFFYPATKRSVKCWFYSGSKKSAHQGRFSAGSRDCKGGGGEPPLHVRVREAFIRG
nr:hypothetical protein [Cronobacter malonaticus]EGT4417733.1 hypothetical protein [Cronobacter malonaticus]